MALGLGGGLWLGFVRRRLACGALQVAVLEHLHAQRRV